MLAHPPLRRLRRGIGLSLSSGNIIALIAAMVLAVTTNVNSMP